MAWFLASNGCQVFFGGFIGFALLGLTPTFKPVNRKERQAAGKKSLRLVFLFDFFGSFPKKGCLQGMSSGLSTGSLTFLFL